MSIPADAPLCRWCVEAASIGFDMTTTAILGRWQARDAVRARWAACWLARHAFGMSYPEIGRAIGKRDHTTILSGVRGAELLRQSDAAYAERLRQSALLLLGRIQAHAA